MSYGLAFGFPRNTSLAAAASPFATLGPTLDLVFAGPGSSGVPNATNSLNDSLDLDFVGDTYSVSAPYMVWGGTGMTASSFQNIVTFSRSTSNATYYNSSGYLTTAGVWNYLTQSNVFDNAAWVKSNSFVQTNLLTFSDAAVANYTSISAQVVNTSPISGFTNSVAFPYTPATNIIAYKSYTTVAGIIYTLSAYVQMDDGGVPVVTTSPTAGDFTLVTENNPTPTNITVTSVGGGVYRVYASITALGGGTNTGVVKYNTQSARGFKVTGLQLVQGSVPGNYQATTSTSLPVLYADYNGALRARKLCENTANALHYVTPNALASSPLTANQVYSYSVKVKAGERTRLYTDGRRKDNTFFNLVVDLSTGVVTPGTNLLSYSTVNLGSGWWQVNFTVNVQSGAFAETWAIAPDNGAGGAGYTGDGSSGIYVSDAQVAPTDIGTNYFNTTTDPYNAPRFDYDPVTLLPRGLLIEEQRANLLLQSNDFLTSWTPTNITRTLNSTLSPEGVVNGVKLEATASTTSTLYQNTAVASTAATFSVYVKQGTGATTANGFVLRNFTTATNLLNGTLNYSTGVWTYSVGSSGVVIRNIGNGWWRVEMSATAGITSGDLIGGYVGFSGGVYTAGDFLYAYGAQLEAGGAASSYIPTTTSQLTRAADLAIVYTLSPWFNAQAGTVYVQFDSFYPTTSVFAEAALIAIYPGGNDGFVSMGIDNATTATTFGGTYLGSATFQASFAVTNGTWYTPNKIANSYKLNDFAFSSNGAAAVVDTSGVLPTLSATHALVIGSFGSSRFINGHIRRISYYPRRLSDTELQTLTAL